MLRPLGGPARSAVGARVTVEFLKDLPVLVLGLGDSGLAMARWCARWGARVTVWDSRTPAPHDAELRAELPQVRRIGGELDQQALAGVQLVLKSPGLAPQDARVAPLLEEARASAIASDQSAHRASFRSAGVGA